MATGLKFNMGCGVNFLPGHVNVDKVCTGPEWFLTPSFTSWDLERFPWPWENDCASAVVFNHSLEHMGQTANVFLEIMQELWRICEHEALVQINVPHPRHDDFLNDPTHVRAITPEILSLFSRKNCEAWKAGRYSNTPLAFYLGVDFETVKVQAVLDPAFTEWARPPYGEVRAGTEIAWALHSYNNCVKEIHIELRAIKQAR